MVRQYIIYNLYSIDWSFKKSTKFINQIRLYCENKFKKIMDDLCKIGEHITIIIVSHRHIAFNKCKKILKLENKKIQEIQ